MSNRTSLHTPDVQMSFRPSLSDGEVRKFFALVLDDERTGRVVVSTFYGRDSMTLLTKTEAEKRVKQPIRVASHSSFTRDGGAAVLSGPSHRRQGVVSG
jgi:hypothetical protein